jgi:hypothetical protein
LARPRVTSSPASPMAAALSPGVSSPGAGKSKGPVDSGARVHLRPGSPRIGTASEAILLNPDPSSTAGGRRPRAPVGRIWRG